MIEQNRVEIEQINGIRETKILRRTKTRVNDVYIIMLSRLWTFIVIYWMIVDFKQRLPIKIMKLHRTT